MNQIFQSDVNYSVDDSKPQKQRDEEQAIENFEAEAHECCYAVKESVDTVLTEHSAVFLLVEDRRYNSSFTFWEDISDMSTRVLEKLHDDLTKILQQREQEIEQQKLKNN